MQKRVLTTSWLCLLLNAQPAVADKTAEDLYEQAVRQHGKAPIEDVFALYARAAEAGHAAAQYNVAMMYANGESVNVDYQQSVYWFRRSSDQNFAPAKFRLGELYLFGMGGLQRDDNRAMGLFRHGAELGDVDAQMNYAVMLASAPLAESDGEEALYWMEQARRGGHEFAQQYVSMLEANPENGLTRQQQDAYWARQRNYWVEMAAAFGVREAEEAVGDSHDPDAVKPR